MLNSTQHNLLSLIKTKQALKHTLETYAELENTYNFVDYDYLLSDIYKSKYVLEMQLKFIQSQINIVKSELSNEEIKATYKEYKKD